MKVLWISNIVFPEANALLGINQPLSGSGGWLIGASQALIAQEEIKLAVASVSPNVRSLTCLDGANIRYYLLPLGKGNQKINHEYESLWKQVKNDFNPDIVHIHGTEFTHGLAYVEACGSHNVCLSIQGLISACYDYFFSGLTKKDILRATTLSSIVLGGMCKNSKTYKQRGEYEKQLIHSVSHIIGRTTWDKEKVWCINPGAKYYLCNETLRSEFYEDRQWDYFSCQKHSIFVSQAGQTIKGFHMLLRAMPHVLQHYPDAVLRVAGSDFITCYSFKERLLLSDYGRLLNKMIKKYNLEERLYFTGPLKAKQMVEEYLKANVFICPSSVENSPNSLGEAQVLGVPVIASYVGGIPDMMKGDEEHLYRYEEIEMLAYKICEVFDKGDRINTEPIRQRALMRHDPQKNTKDLMGIYRIIYNKH